MIDLQLISNDPETLRVLESVQNSILSDKSYFDRVYEDPELDPYRAEVEELQQRMLEDSKLQLKVARKFFEEVQILLDVWKEEKDLKDIIAADQNIRYKIFRKFANISNYVERQSVIEDIERIKTRLVNKYTGYFKGQLTQLDEKEEELMGQYKQQEQKLTKAEDKYNELNHHKQEVDRLAKRSNIVLITALIGLIAICIISVQKSGFTGGIWGLVIGYIMFSLVSQKFTSIRGEAIHDFYNTLVKHLGEKKIVKYFRHVTSPRTKETMVIFDASKSASLSTLMGNQILVNQKELTAVRRAKGNCEKTIQENKERKKWLNEQLKTLSKLANLKQTIVREASGPMVGTLTDLNQNSLKFMEPTGIALATDDTLYIVESAKNRICKITVDGVMTFIGDGTDGLTDGPAMNSQFNNPRGLTINTATNELFVADTNNHCIRKINENGDVSTLAGDGMPGLSDGTFLDAQFNFPQGLSYDKISDNLYVADTGNHCIKKLDLNSNEVEIIAGNGMRGLIEGHRRDSRFNLPTDLAVDGGGNIFVTDSKNHIIRKISLDGIVTTFSGLGKPGFSEGSGVKAQYNSPGGIFIDKSGVIFIVDTENHRIRKIGHNGLCSTLAGSGRAGFQDGLAFVSQWYAPTGIVVDSDNTVIVTDTKNNLIRRIN